MKGYGRIQIKLRAGIVTLYTLDGPWIDSQWEARYSAPVQTGPVAHQASCTMGTVHFRGCTVLGAWHWPPTPPLAPTSKKEYSYATIPALGLHGLFYGKTRHYMEVVSFKPRSLYPRGKKPLNKKLGEVPDPVWTPQRIAQSIISTLLWTTFLRLYSVRPSHYTGCHTPCLISA